MFRPLILFYRFLLGPIFFLLLSLIFTLIVIFRPLHPNNCAFVANRMGRFMLKFLGLKVTLKNGDKLYSQGQSILIPNHQHSFDLFIIGSILPRGMVTLGKTDILMIPIFGILYFLTGNVLIRRKKHSSAINTMKYVGKVMKQNKFSILIFPEGTRSWNRGLGSFKKGAFHLAEETGIPLRPMVISSIYKSLDLSSWSSGNVIVDILPDQKVPNGSKTIDEWIKETHLLFENRIRELDQEVRLLNKFTPTHESEIQNQNLPISTPITSLQ